MATTSNFPTSFGLLLFPGFEVLDAAGPIEALNCLGKRNGFEGMSLSIISKTLDPVKVGSNDFLGVQQYVPSRTFETAPQLDFLLVPGGVGTRDPEIEDYVAFIRKAHHGHDDRDPLKYIMSVCTGALLLAKAGVLDGHKATTNKARYYDVAAQSPKTHWIGRARWVPSGNVWTTSGVSAGADAMLAWMSTVLPQDVVQGVVNTMEWRRAESDNEDPFAEVFGTEDVPAKEG